MVEMRRWRWHSHMVGKNIRSREKGRLTGDHEREGKNVWF